MPAERRAPIARTHLRGLDRSASPVLVFAVAAASGRPFPVCPRTPGASTAYADDQSARATPSPESGRQDQDAGPPRRTAKAGRLHARLHGDAEEAELRPAQGRARAPDQPDGGHGLHPRRRPQPAGALGRADPRRPRQGPAGRALQGHPRRARHVRRQRPQAGALEVRGQEELRSAAPCRDHPADAAPRPRLRVGPGHAGREPRDAGRQEVRSPSRSSTGRSSRSARRPARARSRCSSGPSSR